MRRKIISLTGCLLLIIGVLIVAFIMPVLDVTNGFVKAIVGKDTELIHTYFTDNCAIRTDTDSKAYGITIGELTLDAVYNNNSESMDMALELYNQIGLSDNGCTLVEYLYKGNLAGHILFINNRNYSHTKTRFLGFDSNMRIKIQTVFLVDWTDENNHSGGGMVYYNLTLQRVGWPYKIAYSEGDI